MKKSNIKPSKYHLDTTSQKFLDQYYKRIQNFAIEHHINESLLQDIYSSIEEKLDSKKGPISQKDLVEIINEIGEPDEIFAEEIDFETSENEKNFVYGVKEQANENKKPYEKRQESQWTRPQNEAILLGVCKMFEQSTNINVRIWRILTILGSRLFLATGLLGVFFIGLGIYTILGLIFPIKDKNYNHCSMLKYRLIQIWDLRLAVVNLVKFAIKFIKWIFYTAIPTFLRRCAKLFGPLWKVAKVCFLLARSGFLILVLGNLGILFYYLQTGYVWNNIEMTSIFPAITSWGVALGFLSALLLLLGSIGAIFKKKLMNSASLTTAIVSGILAMIIAGITAIQIIPNLTLSQGKEFTKELLIPIPDKNKPLTINVERDFFNIPVSPFSFHDLINTNKAINYLPYEGDQIKAVFNYTIYTKDKETFAKITENLADAKYAIEHGILFLFHEDRLIFDNVVPLAPIRYSLDLYIPTDWKFNIANPLHANNLLKPERVNKLGYHDPYYDQDTGRCSDWITYDEKENAFFCPLEFSPENWNFRQTIENDIRNNKADELSPLVGLNSDWSQTYRNYDQYRYLHSILWKDNQHFIAKLSDKMLNIFLEIEATVNGKGEINYTKNTVKEVEQKGEMTAERMEFYDGWENLKDFDIIIKDDITDTEYVTKKEFDELVEKYSRCSQ